jgi:hypothetical protein
VLEGLRCVVRETFEMTAVFRSARSCATCSAFYISEEGTRRRRAGTQLETSHDIIIW